MVMIVVPAFTKRQDCQEPIVLAGVIGVIAARAKQQDPDAISRQVTPLSV
jgi:hypothetical protein